MAEYVKAKIVRIMESGSCPMGLKVGDEFELGASPCRKAYVRGRTTRYCRSRRC